MDVATEVAELIEPKVSSLGYTLVRVAKLGTKNIILQVMAERPDGKMMQMEDCATLSHAISEILDPLETLIEGEYRLEVSSPGIDRPLVKLADYVRFSGFEAKVETAEPVGGRKIFKGTLVGVEAETVRVDVQGDVVDVPFGLIARGKLEMTDALLAAAAKEQGVI